MALAEDAESHLTGADQVEWLARLELEHDNLRAALHWAQMTEHGAQSEDQSAETALMGVRAAGALWRFWWTRGYLTEGREKLMRALTSLGGEWMQAEEVKKARAKVLHGIGNVARAQGDFEASRSSFEEALALRRDLGDEWGIAASLGSLGNVAINHSQRSGRQAGNWRNAQ